MKCVSIFSGGEIRIGKDAPMQRNRCFNSFDDEHFQRALHAANGLGPVAALHNQFRDHRVVVGRNHGVRIGRRIHAYSPVPPWAAWNVVMRPADGTKVIGSSALIPAFDCMAGEYDLAAASSIFSPGGRCESAP